MAAKKKRKQQGVGRPRGPVRDTAILHVRIPPDLKDRIRADAHNRQVSITRLAEWLLGSHYGLSSVNP